MKFILAHNTARQRAIEAVKSAPDGYVIIIKESTRSLDQNAALWAILSEIAEQVVWHGSKLDAESWKCVLSAALRKQVAVPNIEGNGFVVLGQSTSKMSKSEFSELLALSEAFAAEQNVKRSA